MLNIFVLFNFFNSQIAIFISYVSAIFLYDLNVSDQLAEGSFKITNRPISMNYLNLITLNSNH